MFGKQHIAGPRSVFRRAFRFAAYLTRRALFPLFERVLPADDQLWCFCSWYRHYHTLDNPRAVLEVVRDDPEITCIVLQKTPGPEGLDTPNVRFIKAESIRGAYYLARSRVLITGYALHGVASYAAGVTRKHLIVALSHGVNNRRVGRLLPQETWWAKETPKYSAMVASSPREQALKTKAYAPVPAERIWITGLPRNSILFGQERGLPQDYREQLADLRRMVSGRRLVLYGPTWRDSEEEHYRFSAEEVGRLEELLRRYNAVFAIHGHPKIGNRQLFDVESEEIIDIGHLPDVTLVLRDTEILITDYSSIFLDFVLTGRPIIHFAHDWESYLRSRIGFMYEPEEFFTGAVPETFDELLVELETALTLGIADPEQYEGVRERFHQHGDDSAEAVARKIRGLVRGPC